MRLLPRRVPGRMRMVAVAVLVVAALACIPDLVRAEMGSVLDHPCAGPGCEQQIACGRPDQVTVPTRETTGPIVVAVPVPIKVVPLEGHTIVVAPPLAIVGWQSLVLLAPRSPPAA